MAWYQQGNPAEAKAAFDESARLIEQSFPNAPVDLGSDWFDWLMYDLLRREAVQLPHLELPPEEHKHGNVGQMSRGRDEASGR